MRHIRRLCDPLLLAVSLPTICLTLVLTTAYAFGDDGAAPALDPSLIDLAFRGIAEGNWFLVAGPALAVLVHFARPVLGWLKPELATSDRWGVVITAVLAGAGALAHAWIADEPLADATTLLGAVKVFVMAVASYVVSKRLIAPKTPAPPSSGSGGTAIKNAGAIGLVSIVVIAVPLLAACPGNGPGPGPVIADAVIDCVGEHRPEIDALLLELTPLLALDSPDWSAVYQRAKNAGKAVGGCALAELVQRYLGGRTAVPESESWRARDTLERFRATEADGATFRTAYGNL